MSGRAWTFLYAEQADPSLGQLALLPGFRPSFTHRGLPDLRREPSRSVPGVVVPGVGEAPEPPYQAAEGHAVLTQRGRLSGVLSVHLRCQQSGGEPTSAPRELMEAVRGAAEACGFPFSWVTEGLALSEVERNFGKAVAIRVESVADRVSRGLL